MKKIGYRNQTRSFETIQVFKKGFKRSRSVHIEVTIHAYKGDLINCFSTIPNIQTREEINIFFYENPF